MKGIMDDGSISSFKATHINTDSFTLEEIKILQEVLYKNFLLKTRIANKRPGQWILVISVRQINPLVNIVGPYMHESMRYKIKGL